MAYAEKRGDYWRGRYRNLPGRTPKWLTISTDAMGVNFTTKQDALDAANDKEAELRQLGANAKDPSRGEITLRAWAEIWQPAQDVEDTSEIRTQALLKHIVLAEFGDRPLNTLDSPEEIAAWEMRVRKMPKLKGRGTYSQRTAADARSLLSTILEDAVEAKRIDFNAAKKRRGRGRKRTRNQRRARSAKKAWVSPLGALLVAERCALISGRDDELVLAVAISWTGMRWGEAIGLEDEDDKLDHIELEWQLKEVGGKFYKAPPKDDSARRIDKPPFLADLLSRQKQNRGASRCACPDLRCEGAGKYLFLTPGRATKAGTMFRQPGHHTRSNFATWYWHPAVSGAYPEEGGARPRPAKPVLVDGNTGRPLRPAWPYAEPGEDWETPRGKGLTRFDLDADLALASWLPIKKGLTPHGLRHSHEVWMQEDHIEEVLRYERLGHIMPGIKEVYSHVSDLMRARVKQAMQRRWEEALEQRAAMDRGAGREPGSHVALLDDLLKAHERKRLGDARRRSSPKRLPRSG